MSTLSESTRLAPEHEHRLRRELGARTQDRRRKLRLVRRIREVLRLEAEAETMSVDAVALSVDRAVEEVAGVELHAGLRRVHVEGTPRRRLEHVSGVREPRVGTH